MWRSSTSRMPPTHEAEGLEAALRIRANGSGTAVLLLSQYIETTDIAQLLGDDPSGVGYLLKDRVADLGEPRRRDRAGRLRRLGDRPAGRHGAARPQPTARTPGRAQ